MSISVLLVDDHPMFRKGLHLLIEEESDMSVVGEAGDGQEAIKKVQDQAPNVVVMDITMPNLNGIEATRQILSHSSDIKVVALSIHTGRHFVKDMLSAGASGYIVKDSVPEELIKCIRKVMHNEVYLSREITGIVVSGFLEDPTDTQSGEMSDESATAYSDTTLFSKILRPAVDTNLIRRQALLDKLDKGIQRPLTLVVAPAGYGKSMTVASWLESVNHPNAWVSLDANDNDLRLFLKYVIAAIQMISRDACRHTLAMVNAITLPPVLTLARNLTKELDQIEQRFILVLDDFHLIHNESILELLSQTLYHPPHAMHLVLACRRDPLLPIASLRATKRLQEIRTQALRFNKLETAAFLTQEVGKKVDSDTAAVLEKKTEGWVTGLRLIALSMRHQGKLDPKLLEPHVTAKYVMEYLFEEVFSCQPAKVKQYLLATAILDRFNGSLCEGLCAPNEDPPADTFSGWDFIARLKKENMFVLPLDAENRWFRFHHLFKKLLRNQLERRLNPEDIYSLHARAAAWFANNGMIEESLQHALAGGDPASAARLIAKYGFDLQNHEQWARLERWLKMLPADTVDRDPELLVLMSWLHVVDAQPEKLASCLAKAEALIAAQTVKKHIQGHLNAIDSFYRWLTVNGEQALISARQACEAIPRNHRWARLFAFTMRGLIHQMLGDRQMALATIEEAMRAPDLSGGATEGFFLASPCFIYWIDANLTNLLQTAAQSLKSAEKVNEFQAIAHGLYFMGIACYHRNELPAAEEHLTALVENPYAQHAMNYAHGAFALALIHQARRREDEAQRVVEAVVSFALDHKNPDLLSLARTFQLELALRQNCFGEKALRWVERSEAYPLSPPDRFYMPHITAVKLLLSQDTPDHRRKAADLLNRLHEFLVAIHNFRFQIDVLALKALLFDIQNDTSAADKVLTESLKIAEPGGFIRPFVDLGPRMADLLKGLAKQKIAVSYIGRILAAFKADEKPEIWDKSNQPGTRQASSGVQPLVEPLTNRELGILELLCHRLSNKEIAVKLFISPATVKKHLNNIYGKLTVSSRREAVEKADALGIIPPR